jgi:hypothetical protein
MEDVAIPYADKERQRRIIKSIAKSITKKTKGKSKTESIAIAARSAKNIVSGRQRYRASSAASPTQQR